MRRTALSASGLLWLWPLWSSPPHFAVAETDGSSRCSSSDQECSSWESSPGQTTLRQLRRQRKCDARDEDEERPLYTHEDWQRLRRLYRDQGGTTVEYPEGEVESHVPPGFVPPMVARQTADGKGRGIFATRDIAKGEMTYGGKHNYAFFPTGEAFRRFIGALSDSEACDVMMWAWPQVGLYEKGSRASASLLFFASSPKISRFSADDLNR